MVRGVHISDLPSVSTVTEDLNLVIDTEEGLKKTSLGELKQFMKIPNVQAHKIVTENGVYEADTDDKVYFGLQWWGTSKSGYTGDKTLIGDYIWFEHMSLFDIEVGDIGYNGKYKDENEEEVIPDITQPLGAVSQKEILKDIGFSFNDRWSFELSGNLTEVNNNTYYKVHISDNAKTDCTVDIVGSFVWVPAENIYTPQYGTLVYNSIDDTDLVPDLSASIGTLNYVNLVSLLHLDFVNGYGFGNRSSAGTNTVIHNKIYDGIAKITVNVPSYEEERNRLLTGSIFENYTLPDNITYLHDYGLAYQYSLSTVNTNNVTYVGPYAFYQCANLKSATLPNLYTISEYMFDYCTQLQSVIMPNVSSIYRSCFNNCTSLTNIDLSNITYMTGNYRFYNCTSLSNIIMPNIQYNINEYDFYNCTSLENIYLKDVYRIYSNAFRDCTNLKYVNFGTTITTINSNSFYGCTQEDLIFEFGLTEEEFNNKSGLANYKPWGATNATILYADSNPHNFKITCLNEDITPEIILVINGKNIKNSETRQAHNTEITYIVSYRNYITQTDTITLTEDMDIKITLEADPNPKYYEIDENCISWTGENIEVIENEYTDNTILRINGINGLENIVINDSEWNSYFENFGNPNNAEFQTLADEFVFTFKINHTYTGYSQLRGSIFSTPDNNNDGIHLYLYREGSSKGYYSYLFINGNGVSEDWRNDGTTYPTNEIITITIKYSNGWIYKLNNSNTWSNYSSGTIQAFTKLFGYLEYYYGFDNSNIEIDFMNTGFKKNNVWTKRLITEKLPKSNLIITTTPDTADIQIGNKHYISGQTIKIVTGSTITYNIYAEDYISQSDTITVSENTTLNIDLSPETTKYEIDYDKVSIDINTSSYPYSLRIDNNNLGDRVMVNVIDPSASIGNNPYHTYPYDILLTDNAQSLLNDILNGEGENADCFEIHYIVNKVLYQYGVDHVDSGIYQCGIIGRADEEFEEVTTPNKHIDEFTFNYSRYFTNGSLNSVSNRFEGRAGYYSTYEYPHQHSRFSSIYGPSTFINDCTFKVFIENGLKYIEVKDNTRNLTYRTSLSISSSFEQTFTITPYLLASVGWNNFGNCDISLDLKHTGFRKNNEWVWRPVKEQTDHISFTINSVPTSATITINGCKYPSGRLINLPINSEVTWKVEADNYISQTGTFTLTENTTRRIVLDPVTYTWDPAKLVLSKDEGAIYELAEDSLGNSVLLRLYETNKGIDSSPLANPFYLEIESTARYAYNGIAGGFYIYNNYPATFELKFKILNQSDIWDNMFLPILGSRMGDGSYTYDESSPKTHKGDGIAFDLTNKELVCLSFWQPEEGSHTSTERGKIVLNTSHEYTNEWTLTLAQGSIKLANGNGLFYENTIVYDSYQTDNEYGYFYAFLNTLFQGGYTKDINANIEIDLLHTGFKDRNGDWVWRPIKVVS